MKTVTRDSLLTLEAYAKVRNDFRNQVMAHKKPRKVALGENISLIFEDALTIRYQIQEMLFAERIFQEAEINHELETYTPLIPDGHNWKVTMMIEYPDPAERAQKLAGMVGIEDQVWVKVGEFDAVLFLPMLMPSGQTRWPRPGCLLRRSCSAWAPLFGKP